MSRRSKWGCGLESIGKRLSGVVCLEENRSLKVGLFLDTLGKGAAAFSFPKVVCHVFDCVFITIISCVQF